MAIDDYFRGYDGEACEECERIQQEIYRLNRQGADVAELVQLQLRHQREHS
jgi:hypothetical protein